MSRLVEILAAAAAQQRFELLEHEVYEFLRVAGCNTPEYVLVGPGKAIEEATVAKLGPGHVFVKIVSPQIAHKTDVGGVVKVPATAQAVNEAAAKMLAEVPVNFARSIEQHPSHAPKPYEGLSGQALLDAIRRDIRGVLVVQMVNCEGKGVGSEVLVALRHNREFGPILTMGVGGVDTELIGASCKKGLSVVSASTGMTSPTTMLSLFRPTLAYQRIAGLTRGGKRLVADDAIITLIQAFSGIGSEFGLSGLKTETGEWVVTELEVNPFGVMNGKLVVLDGLLKFTKRTGLAPARPAASIEALITPKSLGIIGVSTKGMNMGRIILRNILEAGFDKSRSYVVRPGADEIDGVKCVAEIKDLPEKVDLFVLAIGAGQVADTMEQLARHQRAKGVILIAGGMGEKEGGASIEQRTKAAIQLGRQSGGDMVVNGGNCLGIVSRPGHYHTLFIPPSKLPLRADGVSNVALISQSGACMITRISKLGWMTPRYAVSTGNQIDLTVGDFLRYLAQDPLVHTFGVYSEGFKDNDGLECAHVVREIVKSGRDVIFYKAGRTAEGKKATSGHTASLAGDYDVCEAVLAQAGAHVARTLDEHVDLIKISSLMGHKNWSGRRLAAMSNAGYEAVGIADSVQGDGWKLQIATLGSSTSAKLMDALVKGKLDTLVDVHNPLDVTPMANDETHELAVQAFLDSDDADLVLFATVPLTAQMATLTDGVPEEQTIRAPGSMVNRLARILPTAKKPIIASIDSGVLYDGFARALEEHGIPTFRSADVAVRSMGLYLEGKLRRNTLA